MQSGTQRAAALFGTLAALAVDDASPIGLAHSGRSRKTAAEQLPSEIWDIIIGDDLRGSIFAQRYRASCSLVCRAWRNIALSHLFRRIRIPNTNPMGDVAAYHAFLREHPWIAKVVKKIHIGYIPVDVVDLGYLLEAVSHLETLEIRQARVHDSDDSKSPRPVWAYTLPKLAYYNSERDVEGAYGEFMCLLSLFVEIEQLELGIESSSMVVSDDFITSAVKQTAHGQLSIHSLVQPNWGRTPTDSFIPTFLSSIGALHQLTRLDFEVEYSNESVARFGKVLANIGQGLKQLGIIVRRVPVPADVESKSTVYMRFCIVKLTHFNSKCKSTRRWAWSLL